MRPSAEPGPADRDRAVAESRTLLTEHWARWCAERDLTPGPAAPATGDPVVYQVGIDQSQTQWVALIRFDAVTSDGQCWHGMVRGPGDDPVFKVRPQPAETDPHARHSRSGRPHRPGPGLLK